MKKINNAKILFIVSMFFFSFVHADSPYVDKELLNAIEKKYTPFAKKRFFYLQNTLESVKNESDIKKLDAVNTFFNEVKYGTDMQVYSQKDYWATPWEFLSKDIGDCEDYVISKYFALRYLGIDSKKMFFTYVRSTKFTEPHMVLTYFATPRCEPIILDNTNRKIFPASKRTDLIPIYNFNAELISETSKATKKEKSHKKWDELLLNMKKKKI